MGVFYKQISDASEPASGNYTDIAIYKDGTLKVADENGNFVTPFSLSFNPPYICNISENENRLGLSLSNMFYKKSITTIS